ncbi:MAG TPA: ribosome small subunit-dependent GTPase A [Ktedonobacterales bacterium]
MAYVGDAEQQIIGDDTPASTVAEARPSPRLEGLVVAIAQGFFEVSASNQTYLCTLRGRLRSTRSPRAESLQRTQTFKRGRSAPVASQYRQATNGKREGALATTETEDSPVRIAPGDNVLFTPLGMGQGIIEEVLPRRSVLSRARSEAGGEHVMLANLDHAVLVFAVQDPTPHFGMLDRYLSLCEHAHTDVTICLNKVDLGIPEDVQRAIENYRALGYYVLTTSAAQTSGIDILRERLTGRTSLLTGPSGVGKSSLINVLLPEARQRTAAISEATGKGRHTTTGARLLPLPGGGWLADSAGIRELALWNVASDELPGTFIELRPFVDQCEYEDCDHSPNAEGCALRQALTDGHITPERFAGFERLLAEALDTEQAEYSQHGRTIRR